MRGPHPSQPSSGASGVLHGASWLSVFAAGSSCDRCMNGLAWQWPSGALLCRLCVRWCHAPPTAACPAEQMNLAFAQHEIISDHLTACLAW